MSIDQSRRHFEQLSHADQQETIRRLAAEGLGDYELAAATRWNVEAIRAVLGQQRTEAA